MKTNSSKNVINKEKEVKKEFNLKEAFALWKHISKAEEGYLTGYAQDGDSKIKLIGFFNTKKNNPKEPDIRIYSVNEEGKRDVEVASLWQYISKNDNAYLSGKTNEDEKLIGFYGNESGEARPFIRCYYRED